MNLELNLTGTVVSKEGKIHREIIEAVKYLLLNVDESCVLAFCPLLGWCQHSEQMGNTQTYCEGCCLARRAQLANS